MNARAHNGRGINSARMSCKTSLAKHAYCAFFVFLLAYRQICSYTV